MPELSSVGDLLAALTGRAAPEGVPPAGVGGDAVSTGLAPLDALTGGWRPGELVLVSGGAGAGKSALLYAQALHAAAGGVPVALAPLKHARHLALWRLASAAAGVEIGLVVRGGLSAPDRARMESAAAALGALPLHLLVESDARVEDVAEQARLLHRTRGLRLLVVDGLHALGLREEDAAPVPRERRLTSAALALADLARELRVPVLASLASGPDSLRVDPIASRRLEIGPLAAPGGTLALRLRGRESPEAAEAVVRFTPGRLRFGPA